MKRTVICILFLGLAAMVSKAQNSSFPHNAAEDTLGVMSAAYWNIWNDALQERIDKDIDTYRKGDASFKTGKIKRGSKVKVEQISSDFVFGASAFNWNQLGDSDADAKYRNVFTTLFNRATIPFYWKTLEPIPGLPRFKENVIDTEEWWNAASSRNCQPHWRRPSTDSIVEWCEANGVAMHGHPLVWGSRAWMFPQWLQYEGIPMEERQAIDSLDLIVHGTDLVNTCKGYESMSEKELASILPTYISNMEERTLAHAREILERYKGRICSWDVVNESSRDAGLSPSLPMWKSCYGVMFTDYPFKAFETAMKYSQESDLLNINDYRIAPDYFEQVLELKRRGAKIDVVGMQLHLFDPNACLNLAAGKSVWNGYLVQPDDIRAYYSKFNDIGVKTCISEITITSPGPNARGEQIQAVLARNLYRLWFSLPSMMGITWWNLVDNCGAPGEPSFSGIFNRDMSRKVAYSALDELINHEWRTNCELNPDSKGEIHWRGFKGTYRITWIDQKGESHCETVTIPSISGQRSQD